MYKDSNVQNTLYEHSIPLKDENFGLKWMSSNNTYYLDKGTYDVKIYSDSKTDLDSVLLYETGNTKSADMTEYRENIRNLFSFSSPAVKLAEFKNIDPTKYILTIKNATRSFTVSLAEAYDPLWTAYIESDENKSNFRTNSHPLYGVVNGFNINKTGSYDLALEYQPQNWFVQGLVVSVLSIILMLIVTILYFKKFSLYKFVSGVTRRK